MTYERCARLSLTPMTYYKDDLVYDVAWLERWHWIGNTNNKHAIRVSEEKQKHCKSDQAEPLPAGRPMRCRRNLVVGDYRPTAHLCTGHAYAWTFAVSLSRKFEESGTAIRGPFEALDAATKFCRSNSISDYCCDLQRCCTYGVHLLEACICTCNSDEVLDNLQVYLNSARSYEITQSLQRFGEGFVCYQQNQSPHFLSPKVQRPRIVPRRQGERTAEQGRQGSGQVPSPRSFELFLLLGTAVFSQKQHVCFYPIHSPSSRISVHVLYTI